MRSKGLKPLFRGIAKRSGLYEPLRMLLKDPKSLRSWRQAHAHRMRSMRFYAQFLRAGDLCFDVGANLGSRVEIFLKLGAKVVAIEPQSPCAGHLRERFGHNKRATIIQKALGQQEGCAELAISNSHTLSSFSKEWIEAVRTSGRFANYLWQQTELVPVTTLDRLVEQYGAPVFCKIDVEGFELQVLKGLSRPLRAVSFEFTPEYIDAAVDCVQYLSRLGAYRFNCSVGESMCLSLSDWVEADKVRDVLLHLPDMSATGDVYAAHRS